ncbi:arsenic resistance protein ArsB [Natrarchaeobius halalkaliphilus]|uniref:Arsenic resistance protein ArsB n=1 Tax=Natrarchaeobius halalkaliphilus TaxID=1679091 RepID=A0A3N6LS94_9EURY|nr:SLC13 family permease [Natrarchaeobius halalkaliphilus]RQG92763.1 arsenic resistance protein ArsB [Natrarchaeobius halalkaliphilus]
MFGLEAGPVATGVVLATFALLFVRRIGRYPVSRSVTAATGTVVLLALGIVSPQRALEAMSVQTLLLLFGMLVHVTALAQSGFYEWTATQLVTAARTPRRLTLGALALSALLSSLALNDATVLLLTPVLVVAAERGGTDPVPPVLAVVFGANIGSVATPLGNPQNAFILAESDLTTLEFIAALAPVAVVCLLIAGAFLLPKTERGRILETPVSSDVVRSGTDEGGFDRAWAATSVAFVLGTFVLLVALPDVGVGTIAASTAIVHLAWLQGFRRVAGDDVFADVDWSVLVLFGGLFALVAGLDGTALLEAVEAVSGGSQLAIATFGLSNLVSNVPAVVLLAAAIPEAATADWLMLAAVSTLAGNATPIASAATLLTLEAAADMEVRVPLRELLVLGIPLSIVTSVIAVGMLSVMVG